MSFIPSNNNIANIKSQQKNGNTIIKAEGGYFTVKYFKDKTDFYEPRYYIQFIKNIEKEVRNSDEYKAYINYLKTEIGLDYCSVFGNITDEKATIEMHHGPIFTLFDIVSIILEWYIMNGKEVSTFEIAKVVLQEHFDNHVQVVMLSKTAHQAVHAGKIFISPKQAFGDINPFIDKYMSAMTQEQIDTYNQYVELSENNNTTDNGLLKTDLKDWNKEGLITLQGADLDDVE